MKTEIITHPIFGDVEVSYEPTFTAEGVIEHLEAVPLAQFLERNDPIYGKFSAKVLEPKSMKDRQKIEAIEHPTQNHEEIIEVPAEQGEWNEVAGMREIAGEHTIED